MPSCHEVACAYEKAFGTPAVHGRKFTIAAIKKLRWLDYFSGQISNYVHSWNVIMLPSGTKVIIDAFPNETCSLAPIILPHPHPAYREGDTKIIRLVEDAMSKQESITTIDFFAAEFKRITEGG
jgi:hypothetical protein